MIDKWTFGSINSQTPINLICFILILNHSFAFAWISLSEINAFEAVKIVAYFFLLTLLIIKYTPIIINTPITQHKEIKLISKESQLKKPS